MQVLVDDGVTRPVHRDLVLDRYRLGRVLGRGGAGVVHQARDEVSGRVVAVKLPRNGGRRAEAERRLLHEANILVNLRHLHVLELIEWGLDHAGSPIMVTEYVDAGDIEALGWARHFRMPQVLRMLRQIASGLAACHAAGVVHGDVKPGNILGEDREAGLHFKLIDFGLARRLDEEPSPGRPGSWRGSMRYLAPEQWAQQSADVRSDIYALGLVAHRMITGVDFVTAVSPLVARDAHSRGRRSLLKRTVQGEPVPAPLARVIHRATSPAPADRYPSAAAMWAALSPSAPARSVGLERQHCTAVTRPGSLSGAKAR